MVMSKLWALLCLFAPASVLAEAATAAAGGSAAAAAAAQQAAGGYHVVELQNSETTSAEALLGVLDKFGAEKEKALAVIERIDQKGKAVVVAGSKVSCEEAAAEFEKIGMKAEVRPLAASDVPSPYDDSDVIIAGANELNEILTDDNDKSGVLVVFYADWCGHCKTIVPEMKKAAATLKKEHNLRVLAVNGDMSPMVAKQLGVQGYPTIRFLQRQEDNAVALVDYQGQRDADSFVRFAVAANKAASLKTKLGAPKEAAAVPAADTGDAPAEAKPAAAAAPAQGSKLGKSKLAGGAGAAAGMQKAKMPAEVEAEAPERTKPETEAKPETVAA